MGKFWWNIVHFQLCSTLMDNTMTSEHAVLAANIISGYDINIPLYIIIEIHEREFRDSTSISFPCLIDRLCRDSGIQTFHDIDRLIEVNRTHDVGLIKNDTNPVVHRCVPELFVRSTAEPNFEGSILEMSTSAEGPIVAATTSDIPSLVIPTGVPCPPSLGMFMITTEFLHELIQCQMQIETQLAQFIQQVRPWVRTLIAQLEERVAAKM